jgi:plasmid stabilization system protein ParE
MRLLVAQSDYFPRRQVDWYRDNAGSERAVDYVDAVETTVHEQTRMPGIGRQRFYSWPEMQGIRSWRVESRFIGIGYAAGSMSTHSLLSVL